MPSGSVHKSKTHCPQGHAYDEANTYWQTKADGRRGRCCRACQTIRMQRKRENPEFAKKQAEATARWRLNNPEKYEKGWKRDHEEKKQILLDARAGGCLYCGEKNPSCLDFHHRDGKSDKLGDIATMRRFGRDRLLAEIAKCDVLCSNCHRKHHDSERKGERTI